MRSSSTQLEPSGSQRQRQLLQSVCLAVAQAVRHQLDAKGWTFAERRATAFSQIKISHLFPYYTIVLTLQNEWYPSTQYITSCCLTWEMSAFDSLGYPLILPAVRCCTPENLEWNNYVWRSHGQSSVVHLWWECRKSTKTALYGHIRSPCFLPFVAHTITWKRPW